MKTRLMWMATLLGASSVGTVFADAKLPKGTEHSPPVFVDESASLIRVTKNYPAAGFQLEARVANVMENDHFRAVMKQGGKVLTDVKCSVTVGQNPQRAGVECEERTKPLTALGPVEVELIYKDDKTDKEFLVRTYKMTVKNWPNYPANSKEKLWDAWAGDLVGPAWLRMLPNHQVAILFWVNSEANGNPTLRCTVDGKPLPHAVEGEFNLDKIAGRIEQQARNAKGDTLDYKQHNVSLEISSIGWGSKEDIKKEGEVGGTANYPDSALFVEHPGAWVCQLRKDQATLREFAFTVNAQGLAEQDEMNRGKGAIPTIDGTVMIENRIPSKDDVLDEVIQPDKWKASMLWGLAWPDHPKVKKIQATYPAKSSKLPEPQ